MTCPQPMSCLLLLVLYFQSSLWLTASSSSFSDNKDYPIAKPGCPDQCGNISIPYPFGIGANCYQNASYEILCNSSSHPPKAFLQMYHFEVLSIQLHTYTQSISVRIPAAGNMCTGDGKGVASIDFRGTPYRFSSKNTFVVWGCSGSVVLKPNSSTGEIVGGCASICVQNFGAAAKINFSNCNGVGCCQASISSSLDSYNTFVNEGVSSTVASACTLTAALVHKDYSSEFESKGPVTLLEWQTSHHLSHSHHRFACTDYGDPPFKSCSCKWPYFGNPYLKNGCKVARECRTCPQRCHWNETTNQYYCGKNFWLKKGSVYGYSSGAGLVLLILGCYWTYRLVEWRRDIKRKANNFKKNGGLLLQQQMPSNDGTVEKMIVFTTADLEKATDNFHESRILGHGGQGTVYKGMLLDGRIVAIKKSTNVDEGQLDQFINEVVILSQVNHRNVVKLLGCCLETEVPLLVYEFIHNGALYDHIHDPTEDFHVTWKMRLQIALESAGAIAYLHSASSAPIYHRDIKSSNILLDDKFRAKVSDFGTCKAVNIEQTHVTTRVQGTYGYMDPEYFQSNQFTEKSDVYSFGVVLVELITGKKPIFPTECGEYWKSLAMEFLNQMEKSRLLDIIDTRIVDEAKENELIAVADLAVKCLNMNGRLRPTMTEVERALDRIRSPNSNGQIDATKDKFVVTEMDDWSPPDSSMNTTFFTASDSLSLPSIEVLPLIFDT